MKIRSQPPTSSLPSTRSDRPVRNEAVPPRPAVALHKDSFQSASPRTPTSQPVTKGGPLDTLGDVFETVVGGIEELANDAATSLMEPYPESPEAHATEQARIEQLLAEKADWGSQEQAVLDQIGALGVSPVDVWHGSHVVVQDGGALYEQWSQLPGAQERTSSHYDGVDCQQYELDFPPHGALLFGKDADGNTWFQMENHGGSVPGNLQEVWDIPAHLGDYVIHKASGNLNVGPFGLSPHSEKEGQQLVVDYPPSGV